MVGNKGVVGTIKPDSEMPFLEDGTRVDVLLSALGVINRLNPFQLFESSINRITRKVAKKIETMANLKDKEELLFDIIGRFNKYEVKELKKYYKTLNTTKKKEFFDSIVKDGIFIHLKPMASKDDPILFDTIRDIYKDYPWIHEPDRVFVNKFGRKIEILKPMYIGEIYMMKLKQSSKKGFSARATGAMSKRGVPAKSYKNKEHQDLYSSTPIRIGDQESNNSVIGVSPENVAKLHLFYRSSPAGRQNLGMDLVSNIKPLKDFKYTHNVKNRNVEILAAYLKSMGLRIVFPDDYLEIDPDVGAVETHEDKDGSLVIATRKEFKDYKLKNSVIDDFKYKKAFIGTPEEYDYSIEEEIELRKEKKRLKKEKKKAKKIKYYVID